MSNESLLRLLQTTNLTEGSVPDLDSWQKFLSHVNTHLELSEKKMSQQQELLEQVQTYAINSTKIAVLGELLGGISHDVNNPLAVIQLRTDQLLELTEANDIKKEFFIKSLKSIETTGKKISEIINGLRAFIKGGPDDMTSPYSVKKILDSTLALCSYKFNSQGIQLEISCPDDILLECRPAEISQAVLHLLRNSYDAAINLDEKWVRIEVVRNNLQFDLIITDSGSGINKDDQAKMLLPFYTTKKDQHKAGLGLTLAEQIISKSKGHLQLNTNSPNTQFKITFPLAEAFVFSQAS